MRPEVAEVLRHDVVTHRGTTSVLADGLLGAAHRVGVRGIVVELLQAPSAANGRTAVCAATVILPADRFRGLGDASPRNSRDTDAGALLRLAQVRAKSRTLCDALNLALVPAEDVLG